MPVLPQEGNTSDNITDAISGDSSKNNNQGQGVGSKVSDAVHGMAHKANPGPVLTDNDIGKPESKDNLKARAVELNK